MPRLTPILFCLVTSVLSVSLATSTYAGEASSTDPWVTVYGIRNANAPAELDKFAFLVGKWSGTMRAREPDGKYTDYPLEWLGRYVLNGMAIADEMRIPGQQGGSVQGMTLRYFDARGRGWTVEFFNFARSFLRRQVNAEVGAVTQDGARVIIEQVAPGPIPGREVYTVVDADHFTYSLDSFKDGRWDEGIVTIQMQRQEKAP